ncbi:hypothetical protein [Muricoccus aerilatus]|uniref:hypothetical protein n=1 Tax=Muricoccus aerilatus TaxID=452982 RepID=UPI0005C1352A|nr:hypothetical protein [Roseomonas aerilata]
MKTGHSANWIGTAPLTFERKWQVSSDDGATWADVATGMTFSDALEATHAGKKLRFVEIAKNVAAPDGVPVYSLPVTLSAVVNPPAVTLPALTITPAAGPFQIGTSSVAAGATLATISGAAQGATLSVPQGETRYVLNSAKTAILVGASALSTAGDLALAVVQTLAGATNSPRTTTATITVTAAAETPALLADGTGFASAYGGAKIRTSFNGAPVAQSGGTVSAWNDQIGSANFGLGLTSDAPQSAPTYTASNAAFNGLPTIDFDGNGQHLMTPMGSMPAASNGQVGYVFVFSYSSNQPNLNNYPCVFAMRSDGASKADQDAAGFAIYTGPESTKVWLGHNFAETPRTIDLPRDTALVGGVLFNSGQVEFWVDEAVANTPSSGNIGPGQLILGGANERGAGSFASPSKCSFSHIISITDISKFHAVRVKLGALLGKTLTDPNAVPTEPSFFLAEDADLQPNARALDPSLMPATFVLQNWSSSPSVGFARVGMPFARGDIPAGSVPVIRRGGSVVPVQFDERTYWKNGDLKFAVAHLRDTNFAGSESRTYAVSSEAGTYNNTGTKTPADVTSGHDFKVAFSSLTETGSSGTSQVGSGSFTSSLNAHIGVATRREKYHSGPVCESWYAWGMATDNAGGAQDAHLKSNWYVSLWKNSDGSIYAHEIAAVNSQDWWSVPNKKSRNYTMALKDGSTTIETYANVAHNYHEQNITCTNQGGNNRGRRHWVGGAMPTLVYKPNKTYWHNTRVIAPYDPNKDAPVAIDPAATQTYVPGLEFNHRRNIDGTGAYGGRGLYSNMDVAAFMRQEAADVATMRMNAHAGLHVFYHYRSNANRQRPGDSTADVANTVQSLSLKVGAGTQVPYDFTADGMPAPGHCYMDGRNEAVWKNGYVAPEVYDGVWSTTTGDSSHSANYSAFAYALEGERYHLEATLDLAMAMAHMRLGGEFGCYATSMMHEVSNYTAGDRWEGVVIRGQQRNGWALSIIGSACGLIPATHVAYNSMQRFNQQQGRYLRNALVYMSDDIRAAGVHISGSNLVTEGAEHSSWMTGHTCLCTWQNAEMTENPLMAAYAAHISKPSIRLAEKNIYRSNSYRSDYLRTAKAWNKNTNPFGRDAKMRGQTYVHPNGNTLELQSDEFSSGEEPGWAEFQVGDTVYAMFGPGEVADGLKTGQGVPLYVVNVISPRVVQVSLTPGGAPITMPADVGVYAGLDPQWTDQYAVAVNPPRIMGIDSASFVHRMCVVMAKRGGVPEATQEKINKYDTFLANSTGSGWYTWSVVP